MAEPHAADHPVAVVTGAGSGIGREITLALLGAGYRVVLVGRHRSALEQTVASSGADATALVVPADVTVEDEVAEVFRQVERAWQRVDLLVNNAGRFGPAGEADEIDVAEWRATVETNLTGAFLCAREAVRAMRNQAPQGGRIINNGSISAHTPRPRSAAYTASKHAITGLTKSLSLDGRTYNIACGQIDIGNAATEMTAGIAQSARQAGATMEPEPTFDAAHVGEAVLYMARLPLEVNVQFMTVLPTAMPYIGRG